MNDETKNEIEVIKHFVGEKNVETTGPSSVSIQISRIIPFRISFDFPSNYPNSPPKFVIEDKSLSDEQVNALTSKISHHFEQFNGNYVIGPLLFKIRNILMAGIMSSPKRRTSTKRLPSKKEIKIDNFFPTDNDQKKDQFLLYLYYKALEKVDEQPLDTCIDNLKSLGLFHSDEPNIDSKTFLHQMQENVSHNTNIPPQIREYLLSKNFNSKIKTETVSRARFFKMFTYNTTLGHGGYGSVIKAVSNYDQRVYAVKCVQILPGEDEDLLQRESQILSKMSHRYIVTYYYSWLEECTDEAANEIRNVFQLDEDDNIFDSITGSMSTTRSSMSTTRSSMMSGLMFNDNNSEGSFDQDDDEDPGDLDDLFANQAYSFSNDSPDFNSIVNFMPEEDREDDEEDFMEEEFEEEEGFDQEQQRSEQHNRFLFMQMEYCSGRSLDDLFRDDSFFQDPNKQWKITRQVLEALKFMHGKGIIHRDMKPSNIFIDENGNAKIGDFGLSRIQRPDVNTFTENTTEVQGSFPYTAPEVMKKREYDISSDMYSFGIILFEIWCQFKTMNERARILRALYDDHITPRQWTDQFPIQDYLVKKLVNSPENRPSAKEILQSGKIPPISIELTVEDTSELLRALSSGTIRRSQATTDVLDALFSETRKQEFNQDSTPKLSKENFHASTEQTETVLSFFSEQARLYGASLFTAPILEQLTVDQPSGIQLMRRDGDLYVLKSNPYTFMIKEILKNDIKNARFFQATKIVEDLSNECKNISLSYEIVEEENDPNDWTKIMECMQFAFDLSKKLKPDIDLHVVVSNSHMAQGICKESNIKGSINTIRKYCSNDLKEEKRKRFDAIKDTDFSSIPDSIPGKEVTEDFIYTMKTLMNIAPSISFELFSDSFVDFDGLSLKVKAGDMTIAKVGTVKADYFDTLKSIDISLISHKAPAITSASFDFKNLRKLCINRKSDFLRVLLIPYWKEITDKDTIMNESRPVFDDLQWAEMISKLEEFTRKLRNYKNSKRIRKTSIDANLVYVEAENDGKSIKQLFDEGEKSGYHVCCAVYLDGSNTPLVLNRPNPQFESLINCVNEYIKIYY